MWPVINKDVRANLSLAYNKLENETAWRKNAPAIPCGLMARSYFNDTY